MQKLLLFLLFFPLIGLGQQTYVPDDAFEQQLINYGLDNVLDDSVLTINIQTFSYDLDVSSLGITDLTGIEDFILIDELDCSHNLISVLDVSNCDNLVELYCTHNQITSLDVSDCLSLKELYCYWNPIEDLIVNPGLELLYCVNTELVDLDLSNDTSLQQAYLNNNANLQTIDVRSGNNFKILTWIWDKCPLLYCVLADDTLTTALQSFDILSDSCYTVDLYGLEGLSVPFSNAQWAWNYRDTSQVTNELSIQVLETLDGGLVILGKGSPSIAGGDILVIKTDSYGNILWSKNPRGFDYNLDNGNSIKETADGGFIVAGSLQSSMSCSPAPCLYPILYRLDSVGNLIWKRIIPAGDLYPITGNTTSGAFNCSFIDIEVLIDGYLLLGDWNNGTTFLMKTDLLGNKEWVNTYSSPSLIGAEASSMAKTIDNGVFFISHNSISGDLQTIVTKTDSLGLEIWQHNIIDNVTGYSVARTVDGGCIVAGRKFVTSSPIQRGLLTKMNSSGIEEWTMLYDSINTSTIIYSVEQMNDGGYLLTGNWRDINQGYDNILVIKTDSAGVKVWSKSFSGGGGDSYMRGYNGIETADGSIVVSSTRQNGSWSNPERGILLIKLGGTATTINEFSIGTNHNLLKVINMLGQETTPKPNTPLFYIYDDGTVKKQIIIE